MLNLIPPSAKSIRLTVLALVASLLLACQPPPNNTATPTASTMNQQKHRTEILAKLEFSCVHEQFPPLPAEPDSLYRYALYHDLQNRYDSKAGVLESLLPYYRIAAANGHYKASLKLLYLFENGKVDAPYPRSESIEIIENLSHSLPATANWYWTRYIRAQHPGLTNPPADAFAYLRRAADLGNADAQYVLGNQIIDVDDPESHDYRLSIMDKLYNCAGQQNQAVAARMSASGFKLDGNYPEALKFYYHAAKAGDTTGLYVMMRIFSEPWQDERPVDRLGQKPDPERSKRYRAIKNSILGYTKLLPDVAEWVAVDLDQIAPLPPAKLPQWDGKTAFQRFYEGPAPAKPSDELVAKLAAAKNLDPKTGLPLKDDDTPAKPKVHKGFF